MYWVWPAEREDGRGVFLILDRYGICVSQPSRAEERASRELRNDQSSQMGETRWHGAHSTAEGTPPSRRAW
jgi:hypothetical protein